MKKIIIVSSVILFFYFQAKSQIAGNAIYSNAVNRISLNEGVDLNLNSYSSLSFSPLLEANVMINVKATAYTAIFSLTQNGNTIEETENLLKTRIELFRKALEQDNIDPRKIFVDPVSLVPSYEIEVESKRFSKTINEVPSGFEMKKNVHVTFNDHSQINRIIAVAAQAEVYDLVKVDYSIDNMEPVLDQLRQEALRILLNKKESVEKAGLHIRFIQTGEKYGSAYPLERYAEYYAYKTGVTPTYTANYKKGQPQYHVQYNYAEKNKTIYYEKVADKQFDKILNPVVGEPMIQVYLTLKAQYATYDPETEAADKLYNQKVRELQLREMELRIEDKKADIEIKRRKGPVQNPKKPTAK